MPRFIPIFATLLALFCLQFASLKWGYAWLGRFFAENTQTFSALTHSIFFPSLVVNILLTIGVTVATYSIEKQWPRRPNVFTPKGLLTWAPFVGVLVIALGVGFSTEAPVSVKSLLLAVVVAFFATAWKLIAVFRLFFPWVLSSTSRSMALIYTAIVFALFELTHLGLTGLTFNSMHIIMVTSAIVALVYGYWTLQTHRVWPVMVFGVLQGLMMMTYPTQSSMLELWGNVILVMMAGLALWALFSVLRADTQKRA